MDREAGDRLTADGESPAALLLGWHGSKERHLRPLARHYQSLGLEAVPHVPRTFRAMARPDGWIEEGARARDRLRALGVEERPWIAHAFSNAGFWTLTAMLDDGNRLPGAHAGTVLDSAPGFSDRITALFTARYATRAMLPGVLRAIGQPPAHRHAIVGPPVAAFLGLWHLTASAQVRFMETSLARVRLAHHDKPLLFLYGGKDELAPPRFIERFVSESRRDGAKVSTRFFADGEHVRHVIAHRQIYLEEVTRFAASCVATSGA